MTNRSNRRYLPSSSGGGRARSLNAQSIEDITRREFMFSDLGAALLIACGDDEGERPRPTDGR